MARIIVVEKEAEALFTAVLTIADTDMKNASILNNLYKRIRLALDKQKHGEHSGTKNPLKSIKDVEGPIEIYARTGLK